MPATTLKIKPPAFSGKVLEWQQFVTLFKAYLSKYPEAEPCKRVSALLEALSTEEAKSIATRAADSSFDFNKALEALEKCYGQKKLIYSNGYQTAFSSTPIDLSYSTISEVIQQLEASLETFKSLGKDTVDHAMAHHTEGLLSSELRKRWTAEAGHMEEQPSLQMLLDFLHKQLPSLQETDIHRQKPPNSKFRSKPTALQASVQPSCLFCKEHGHPLYACEGFKAASRERRQELVRLHKLCRNCLSRGHSLRDCTSNRTCRRCGEKHHTLLHQYPVNRPSAHGNASLQTASQPACYPRRRQRRQWSCPCSSVTSQSSMLPTAYMYIKLTYGARLMVVRAILDTGASLNIITNRVVQFLGLDCAPQNVVIAGASGDLVSKRSTTMQLTSPHEVDDTDYLEATCHVVHQLVSAPHCPEAVAVRKDPWTKRLQPLANRSFGKGGSVDLLLVSKAFSEASVEQTSKHPTRTFTALNTIFGWVVLEEPPVLPTQPWLSGQMSSPHCTPYSPSSGRGKTSQRYEPASTIKITTRD